MGADPRPEMAGDRVNTVNAAMNVVSNGMIITGAAVLLTGLIGLMLARAEDEKGGNKHDDADH